MPFLEGDWKLSAMIAETMVKRLEAAKKKTLVRIGTFMEMQLKKGMTDQAPGGKKYADLHPFTIAQRKKGTKRGIAGTKALIHHGDLRNSITHRVEGDEVFVGVLRGERKTKDGLDFVNLAEIHEHGAMIRVTAKMRAYLRGQGLPLKATTQLIVIPARPTFGPTFEAQALAVLKIISDTLQKEMGIR